MSDLSGLLNAGGADALLFVPTAIALGALHGLEPGHSKTMMAAFIVAVRGTVMQAVLLGVAATVSHTLVVWLVAMTGLYFGSHWRAEHAEPYLQIVSGALMLVVAAWMGLRYWRDRGGVAAFAAAHDHGHHHHHHHDHDHDHGQGHAGHVHGCEHEHDHEHDEEQELGAQAEQGRQDHHHRNFGHPRRRPPAARS
ncbi:MAG TPA: nickel/cobalt efflux protein RcnA, partial [Methylocystis sp.]|nr:nickel/cobalt efflux protein RcnA [Methylocystis sp.]